MDSQWRRKRKYIFWSRVVGVLIVLFPLSFHKVDFRASFTQGVSVSAHKASPAYAAFEDLREDYQLPEFSFPENGKVLTTGVPFDFKGLTAHARVAIRHLTMTGLTIRTPATEPRDATFFAGARVNRREVDIENKPAELTDRSGALLPLAERKRNLAQTLAQETWSTPSPAARAEELVQQEIRQKPPTRSPRPRAIARNEASANIGVATAMSARLIDPSALRPLWLLGQVEMTEGLAFVGPETQMIVKRVFDGHTYETGRIWVSEGRFEIRIKEAVGYLVAELLTRQGQLLGRGEINLLDMHSAVSNDDRVANLRIPLRPTTEGASFRAVSGYSHGAHKIAVAGAKIEIQAYSPPQKVSDEGVALEPRLSADSSFVARATVDKHWPSLVVGQAYAPQDIRLFSGKLVKALISLNTETTSKVERAEADQQAIVWGRLIQEGQPAAGAQVEMAGDYKPIYFNEMYLPDPSLSATSPNGLFAFIKVKFGVQALRIRAGGTVYPAQVFPTENKHVSYVELDIRSKVVSQFKIFNAFDMRRPVSARLRLVGGEDSLEVSKDESVEYSVAANPFMVEADAGGEFEISRVTVTGSPHVVQVPLIQREWLFKLMQDRRVSQLSQRGIIVGLVDDGNYNVDLTGYPNNESIQIVYIDAQGQPVGSSTVGGGFVIFNAPPGLQTLFVKSGNGKKVFSQIVVAEPEFISIITH